MKIQVSTGFGYYREISTANIIAKANLPQGEHELKDGFEYVEVADQTALDAVEIYVDPEVAKQAADAAKIAEALEKLAIAEVKKDGYVFTSDKYKDK